MSTEIRPVNTPDAPQPAGDYSQAIIANGFVFVAGQGPIDPASGAIVDGDITEQTRLTLDNIARILEAAGSSLGRVVKTTVHLADRDDFAAFNQAYAGSFGDPPPVRTTVQSGLMDIKVEIDVIALTGEST